MGADKRRIGKTVYDALINGAAPEQCLVQQLGAEMARAKAQKKKPLARLRDFLKNSADTAGNLQKLATILGPFVLKLVEKAPEILQFFQAALSH